MGLRHVDTARILGGVRIGDEAPFVVPATTNQVRENPPWVGRVNNAAVCCESVAGGYVVFRNAAPVADANTCLFPALNPGKQSFDAWTIKSDLVKYPVDNSCGCYPLPINV